MKTIYYFTADWCQPCKRTRPIVEDLSREQTAAMFQVIDVDDNSSLANKFMIQSIPTFILFENGIEKNRITGAQTRESLMDFING
jgi:thioredoxin-like negative regulator of GroEL